MIMSVRIIQFRMIARIGEVKTSLIIHEKLIDKVQIHASSAL